MKRLAAAAAVLLLAGCAHAPRPQVGIVRHISKPITIVKPEPIPLPPDKPATFKQRWYKHFLHHPVKWLHR